MPNYRLIISVAGTHPGPFGKPQHVYVWRLEDIDGQLVASNDKAPFELFEGHENVGLYSAMREALPYVPTGGVMLVLAPQEELSWVFSEGLVDLKRRNFRKQNRDPYAHRKLIVEVYELAVEKRLELFSHRPSTGDEVEKCDVARDDAKSRLKDALEKWADD